MNNQPQWLEEFDAELELSESGECIFNHDSEFDVCLSTDNETLLGAIVIRSLDDKDSNRLKALHWNYDEAPMHMSLGCDAMSELLMLRLMINVEVTRPEYVAGVIEEYLATARELREELGTMNPFTLSLDEPEAEEELLPAAFNPLLAV
ncbi:CesT family type III secretion system chaperone [Pleionea sp. CnH1-48]|uniref:CesT family type III secretion system chaperone n=1 Tax=Pleionea sp. CnH1-48 TaxID=2954494 RepID=UPI002097DFA4|nr:CesT family type III secretion system chaperone [Pleionea sp. CnH1-48]MCO7224209.1 CesT family type III secretion system chaperone [Pleionea sp. CnH1-48]